MNDMSVDASPYIYCCQIVFQVRRFRQLQNQTVELGQFYFLGGLRQRQDNLKARSRGMDNYVMSSMPQRGLKLS